MISIEDYLDKLKHDELMKEFDSKNAPRDFFFESHRANHKTL